MSYTVEGLFKVLGVWDTDSKDSAVIQVENLITGETKTAQVEPSEGIAVATHKLMMELEPHWRRLAVLKDVELNPCPACQHPHPTRRLIERGKHIACEIYCGECHSQGLYVGSQNYDGCPESAAENWNEIDLEDADEEQDLISE